MSFRISGLDSSAFNHLFGLSEAELERHAAKRYIATEKPGFPCRVTLEDAEPGESLLLVAYRHHTANTAYRAEGPIFVREIHSAKAEWSEKIPPQLQQRLISLRAYDTRGMMVDADVVDGKQLEPLIERFLDNPNVDYLHAHFARRGCYAALIQR